jgi:chemotaxis protein methyltransferase CheR
MNDRVSQLNGETYYFRDHGQFDLLFLRLLPELIERRSGERKLRLWSAGCSTGEEPYSIALLLDQLLPEREGWDILILGSDIDPAALEKARLGRYGAWSFRMMPPLPHQQYFHRQGDVWELDARIRRMVTFRPLDLIGDVYPGGEIHDMDLILCRNVLIYFAADAVDRVACKLTGALNQGGYLLTGHTELIGHRVRELQSRLFPEGVVYQRAAPAPVARPPAPWSAARPASLPPRPPLAPAPLPALRATDLAGARAHADRGEYQQAEQACRRLLVDTPLAPEPHFLLAQLAQLRSDFDLADELLDKTLYLDPRCVAAYLELAALRERGAPSPRARVLRQVALNLVRELPDDAVIEPYETTAAEISRQLAQYFAQPADNP